MADPPVIGAPGDWFVTDLSAASVSVVIGAGFTLMDGTITFKNANGDVAAKGISLYGASVGLSYTPNVGGAAAKLPIVGRLATRFPRLAKFVTADESKLVERIMLYIWAESPKVRAAITASPWLRTLMIKLIENRSAVSGSGSSDVWKSAAIGLVDGRGGRQLSAKDFVGHCVCYALTMAPVEGSIGTYVLFFGLPAEWTPLQDITKYLDMQMLDAHSNGVALIAAASISAGFPSVSAGATVFWGEIKG